MASWASKQENIISECKKFMETMESLNAIPCEYSFTDPKTNKKFILTMIKK